MKKILSLGLASAMALSMGSAVFATSKAPVYPVGSVGTTPYLYDSDKSAIDLSKPAEGVGYGDTVFYPLLNAGKDANSESIQNAQAVLSAKQAALDLAKSTLETATNEVAIKTAELEVLNAKFDLAKAVLEAATNWEATTGTEQAYIDALLAFDNSLTAETVATDAVTSATGIVSTVEGEVNTLETEKNTAISNENAATAAVATATDEVADAQSALDAILASDYQYVHEADSVSGIKIKQKWDMNSKLVKSVEIAKKKLAESVNGQKYIYFVSVALAESASTSTVDLSGVISLRKSGSFDYDDMQLSVDLEVGFPVAEDSVIKEKVQLFKDGAGFNGEEEEEFTFECDSETYYVVNTIGQGKVLLAATTDYDSTVANRFPEANLDFFYGNGGYFNRTGTLYLSADEGSFLYLLNADGSLTRVMAEYDEYDEAFIIKTRVLGKYVISDVELANTNAPSVDNNTNNNNSGTITNPGTGAAI